MDKQLILQKFKARYSQFTVQQKKIARYLLDHYEAAAFMSASKLAEAVGVSDATVIRFAAAAGFKGYADLAGQIRASVNIYNTPDERISQSLSSLQSSKKLFREIMQNDIEHLIEFSKTIDMQRIDRVVDEIYKAKRIFLMGIGSSALMTTLLHIQLRRMGFDVASVSENTMFDYEKMLLIKQGDLLLACSMPRYAQNTLNAAAFAKKRKARVVAITDSDFSPISISSDILLRVRLDNVTFFHSWVVPMELCNLILMGVLARQGEKIYANVKKNKELIRYFYRPCQKD